MMVCVDRMGIRPDISLTKFMDCSDEPGPGPDGAMTCCWFDFAKLE